MRFAREVIIECLKYLNPKSVLDLGCGNKKFTTRFIKEGTVVTGVDKIKHEDITDKNFKFIQKDIRNFEFSKEYDLIFASMVLHFISRQEVLGLIRKIKKSTSEKGYNFLICMSDKDNLALEEKGNFYTSPEELNKLYSDWEIIKNEQCLSKKHKHRDGNLHQHKIIIFLAKKRKLDVNPKR